MIISKKAYTLVYSLVLLLAGCVENDLPYPTIVGEIKEFEVEGMTSSRILDATKTVNVKVADTVDVRDIKINKFVVTDGMTLLIDSASCLDYAKFPKAGFAWADSLEGAVNTRVDFSKKVPVRLSLYQDYDWTIELSREVSRSIKVKNQVGSALVDDLTKTIIIYVDSTSQPSLRNIEIEELRFSTSIEEVSPSPSLVTDFTKPRIFHVSAFDVTNEWTVSVQYPNANVQLTQLSAWVRRAYIKGSLSVGDVEAQYRKNGTQEWESVLDNEISRDGSNFLVMMTHLSPGTTYDYRLTLNGSIGEVRTFTTDTAVQVPNLGFDEWVMKNEKTWYPNATLDDKDHFWDSGNEGASIASKNPTSPETKDVVKGKAAYMASAYIDIASKFAAGNIYTGDFVKLAGMDGAELDFGLPYTSRPSALKGYYKYTPGIIDKVKAPYEALLGKADSCHIYIGLYDWSAPFRVNSTTQTFVDLSWSNESMIAFGELKTDQSTAGNYKQFKINLKYRDYFTKPTYILIVATASKFGDYFTGSTSSVLLLDECELMFE